MDRLTLRQPRLEDFRYAGQNALQLPSVVPAVVSFGVGALLVGPLAAAFMTVLHTYVINLGMQLAAVSPEKVK